MRARFYPFFRSCGGSAEDPEDALEALLKERAVEAGVHVRATSSPLDTACLLQMLDKEPRLSRDANMSVSRGEKGLSKQAEFTKVPIQRQFVSELTMERLSTNETSDFDACEEGHTTMSLFRKPNRKFRQRLQHSDSEDEDDREEIAVVSFVEKSPPRPEPVSANISEAVDVDKGESKAPASLLSFGDDEDETEVFKVKKSSYSRRLAKQLERDRKKKLKEAVKAETKPEATPPPAPVPVEKTVESKSPRPFSDELEIKIKNTIKILNSEEMKDLDGSSGSDKDGDDNGEGIRFRRFKNVIQSGVIPDAATIYALKKQRQMAREMGDFVPLEPQEPERSRA
ncbi:hypothetical protein HPB47_027474 [Ixodes persulcatus]|uniref:Uncharacterized protein n=1 Tax=Ixodes persulcatus TaxID=34615 RepID=A0AC60PWD8_IXOPE|nr:hypothetical protein HPB47_027474 [Ixodes persulcatus]